MKIYIYRLNPSEMDLDSLEFNAMFRESFYAITDDKQTAKEFKSSRNTKKFIEKIVNMTEEEYNIFENRNSMSVLESVDLMTILNPYTKDVESRELTLIVTEREYSAITSFHESEIDCVKYPPYIFDDNIKSTLFKLRYISLYNWRYNIESESEDEDDILTNIIVDEVNLFLSYFGNLL